MSFSGESLYPYAPSWGVVYRTMPATDLDGNPRPDAITSLPDIGAYVEGATDIEARRALLTDILASTTLGRVKDDDYGI